MVLADEIKSLMENGSSVFLMGLIVGGNFLGQLYGKDAQRFLTDSPIAKHVIAFLTLSFFVVLTDSSSLDIPAWILSIRIVLLYILFLLIFKCEMRFTFMALFLLGVAYFLKFRHERKEKDQSSQQESVSDVDATTTKDTIPQIVIIFDGLAIALLVTIICGLLTSLGHYAHLHRKSAWKWTDYAFGQNNRANVSLRTSHIPKYMKIGLQTLIGRN